MRAAADLFYAEGYGVSIEAIAERAGVAKPTVYAHFASKEALIAAVLDAATEQWFDELDAEVAHRAGNPVSQIMAPFDLLVEDLPDPAYRGCVFVNSAAAFPDPAHPARQVLAAHHERMLERFEGSGSGGRGVASRARREGTPPAVRRRQGAGTRRRLGCGRRRCARRGADARNQSLNNPGCASVHDDATSTLAPAQPIERVLEVVERDLGLDQAVDRQPPLDVQPGEPREVPLGDGRAVASIPSACARRRRTRTARSRTPRPSPPCRPA